MLNYVPAILNTILDFLVINLIYNTFLKYKFSKFKYCLIFILTTCLIALVSILTPSFIISDTLIVIINFLYIILFYEGSIFKKIKLLVLTFIVTNAIILLVNFSLEYFMSWPFTKLSNNLAYTYLQKFINFLIIFVIFSLFYIKNKYRSINSKIYTITIIILMILNIVILVTTFDFYVEAKYSKDSLESLVLVIVFLNFIIVIITLILFNLLQNHLLKMHETEIKALTSERMTEYYRNLAGNTEEIRKFRHDMRYHAQVIDTYLDQGQTLKARDYLKTNIGQLSYRNLIYIEGLPVVSAILSDIQAKCKQLNYRFEPEVYVNYIPMDDDDTSIIIGNILTNALEALKKDNTQDRFILFEIKAAAEVTVISCRNHYIGKLLSKGTLYRTTKSNASNHGYGLNTIQEKTAKYNGLMEITTEHQVFHIQIFLPNNYPQESGNPRKTTTINEETPNYES